MNINLRIADFVNWWNKNPTVSSLNIHGWFACVLVYHLGKHFDVWHVAGVVAAITAAKEFYWDKHFEAPRQAFKDSLVDWAGYLLGAGLALAFTACDGRL